MREQLQEAMLLKTEVNQRLNRLKKEYMDQYQDLIYITDHAIVRYLERIKGMNLFPYQMENDAETITAYLRINQIIGKELREQILPQGVQRRIIQEEISDYRLDGYTYVIRNLSLVTIIKD